MSFLTEDSLPEPQRQNLQRYLDSTLAQIVTAVAEARNLETGAVRDLVDSAPYGGSRPCSAACPTAPATGTRWKRRSTKSEERRVGKGGGRTVRSWWSPC